MSEGPADLAAMAVHHRGVVMPWECDDMGHLNIRFHVARYEQALRHAAGGMQFAPAGARRVADRIVFVREARTGARLACSLGLPATDEQAGAVSGCLWDMGSGDTVARFETSFSDPAGNCPAGEPSFDMAWRDQPTEGEWISAMGVLPDPVDDPLDRAGPLTAAVSDANAIAVLDLSRGSPYRMDESPVGFVVAELGLAYPPAQPAGTRAFSVSTALLGRSRRSLIFRHRFHAPEGGPEIVSVRSVCVFFDRRNRQSVPIPFDF